MAFGKQFLYRAFRPCELKLRFQSTISYKEIRIPVPWGNIAGKFWGSEDRKPILTVHGWLDNCNSFDFLIPLLPKNLSYLCIDLPGHGYSSKLPDGMFYHPIDYVTVIRRIQEYFKWRTLSLMGHSLGAAAVYNYSYLHPENVDFIVCIDGIPPYIDIRGIDGMRAGLDEFLRSDKRINEKTEPPSFTIEKLVEKMYEASEKSIDFDKCEHFMKRNIRPSEKQPGKYFFATDPRIKGSPLLNFNPDLLFKAAERVNFPFFYNRFEKTWSFANLDYLKKTLEVLKVTNKDFEMHTLKGRHHEHFNNPEPLAELITKFLIKYAYRQC